MELMDDGPTWMVFDFGTLVFTGTREDAQMVFINRRNRYKDNYRDGVVLMCAQRVS